MDEATKLLSKWKLDQKKSFMTYRILSRKLGVNVDEAKKALEAFAKKNPELEATYVVSGTLIPSPEPSEPQSSQMEGDEDEVDLKRNEVIVKRAVFHCRADDVENKTALLKKDGFNKHIYTLAQAHMADSTVIFPEIQSLRSAVNFYNPPVYGTTTTDGITKRVGKAPRAATKSAAIHAAFAPKLNVEEKKKVEDKKPSTSGKLSFDYFSKPKKEDVNKVEKPSPPPVKAKKAESSPKKSDKKAPVDNFDNDDDDDVKPPLPIPKKGANNDLRNIFDEDNENDAPVVKPTKKSTGTKRKSTANNDAEDSNEETSTKASGSSSKPVMKKAKSKSPEKEDEPLRLKGERNSDGKVKKTRRVTKSTMGFDAKGYMVTIDVSEDEEYFSDTSDIIPSKKSKPKPKSRIKSESPEAEDSPKKQEPERPKQVVDNFTEHKASEIAPGGSRSSAAPKKKVVGKGGQQGIAGFFKPKA